MFFDFVWPLLGPISNHIGPNLTISGTKSPNLCMYMSCCLIWHHHRLWRTSLPTTHIPIHIWHLSLDTWYLWTRYPCVSVDQIFMGVCRPDIYGYLVTRYLWVSVILFLPEGKAVAKLLIAIPVLLDCFEVTFDDSWSFTTFTNYKLQAQDKEFNRPKIRNLKGNTGNKY